MSVIARCFLAAWPVLVALTAAHAGDDPLQRFFPSAKDVPGLEAAGDARHASGQDLTLIYDGGYQRYLDAGVVSASQRYFRLRDVSVEITLHQMNNQEAAERFMASLCKDIKAPVESRSFKHAKGQICVATDQGTAYGYLALGNLLAMTSFDRGDSKAPLSILQAVGVRAAAARNRH